MTSLVVADNFGGRTAWAVERVIEGPTGGPLSRHEEYQARWTDGSPHLLIGRTRGVGQGEGSSGLRFGALETAPPAEG